MILPFEDFFNQVYDKVKEDRVQHPEQYSDTLEDHFRWMTSMFDAQDSLSQLTTKDFASMLMDGGFPNYKDVDACQSYYRSVWELMWENSGAETTSGNDDGDPIISDVEYDQFMERVNEWINPNKIEKE